ncbi:TolC family protein [Oleiagrimonas sp. C23AA]|uniref:TolC family protein n=1 Tax=Oleiagrimonas sp. C23AA TaxID=2719047 RepID=UPI00142447EB|nr:TolC family protein [Oleiagrimonas sp. C23AA]NII11109.1 TolC family protein [Oleiagrimonas sp. C23AA]
MRLLTAISRTAPLALVLLSGCVAYQAHPLPDRPHWQPAPTQHGQPLTLRTATSRALQGNPDYRAARLQAHVSQLQLKKAGLLPDPQFSASIDSPVSSAYQRGWSLGLTQDLGALIGRGSRLGAARARLAQKRLQLVWKGWSLEQKTAADYVALWDARERIDLLKKHVHLLHVQLTALDQALAQGDVTRQQQAAALTSLSQAQAQLAQARQDRIQARQSLNDDMGVAPDSRYAVTAPERLPLPSRTVIDRALAHLPESRPDLRALAAGYRAADADFRAAVLAQFPGLSVNLNRASDTSGVLTNGFGINLSLPIFGRAQASARLARATREQLHAAYQARLDSAQSQAVALYARLREVQQRQQVLHRQLRPLRQLAKDADSAFRAGHFSVAEWSLLQQQLIDRQTEALQARATLAKGQVALSALLGRADSRTQTPPPSATDLHRP